MSDDLKALTRRLVVGHKSDGRSVYDEAAKAELVAACARRGASVSRLARECGINANQLWRWVREHEQRRAVAVPSTRRDAFVEMPVEAAAASMALPAPSSARPSAVRTDLQARLPNGVMLDVRGIELRHAVDMIEALGRLRCSASTTA
jgi:transposase